MPAVAANDRLEAGSATFRDFALASTANSLVDDSNPINRDWTSNTAETLAEVVSVDAAQGLARVRFKSVECELAIPLGWHAIEDRERAAIFTPDRSARLILWRVDLAFEGAADVEKYVTAKQAALRTRIPQLAAQVRRLAEGEFLAVYTNVPARRGDSEPRVIFDLVTPNPTNKLRALLMTLGVPASRADRYLPLLALLSRERKVSWRSDL